MYDNACKQQDGVKLAADEQHVNLLCRKIEQNSAGSTRIVRFSSRFDIAGIWTT